MARTGRKRVHFERLACAALAAALHFVAAWYLAPAIVERTKSTETRPIPERRALLITTFLSEEAGRAPRFAMLSAMDLAGLPRAIELSIPRLPDIIPVAADSFERARKIGDSEDIERAQRLQGLYVGQIKARLQRVLEASSGLSESPTGHCVVYIVQNERGQVLDVMSDECEGSAEWRQDIESAIRRVSPLPLPPEGLAMGSYLALDLSSLR